MMNSARALKAPSWRQRLLLILTGAALLLGPPVYVSVVGATSARAAENKQDLKTTVIPVEGMVCVACAATVKKAIKSLSGVSNVEVSLENRTARVTFATAKISLDRITAAIDGVGYKAGTPKEVE